jgi:GTP cyclohydrolase I
MVNRRAAAEAIEAFLRALGHEPEGELSGTGERVADAWADDLIRGESIDATALLRDGSMELGGAAAGLVVVRELAVTTMCPHHLLPAQGTATVAYLPGERIAGIGTIASVVDAFARRLTLQEHIGSAVADLLVRELGAKGALCRLRMSHACLTARGERKTGSSIETLALAGSFASPSSDRELALAALGGAPGAP